MLTTDPLLAAARKKYRRRSSAAIYKPFAAGGFYEVDLIVDRSVAVVPITFANPVIGERVTVGWIRVEQMPARPRAKDKIECGAEKWRVRTLEADDGYEYTIQLIADDD